MQRNLRHDGTSSHELDRYSDADWKGGKQLDCALRRMLETCDRWKKEKERTAGATSHGGDLAQERERGRKNNASYSIVLYFPPLRGEDSQKDGRYLVRMGHQGPLLCPAR